MTRLSGWRRVANAIWRAPSDPQIYGTLDVDAGPLLRFQARARDVGARVTATHLVGRALAHALREVPALNERIAFGRAEARATVDVFFITAVKGGADVSGVKVVDVARKSALDVAEELGRRAGATKAGRDADFARSKAFLDVLPMPVLRVATRLAVFAASSLQLELRALGLRASPFGSAMITSVGMLGIEQGFAPLAWIYDVPIMLLVGEIRDRAVVVEGRVEARPMLPISATIDHRYVDGWQISHAMRALKTYLAAPERFEPPVP